MKLKSLSLLLGLTTSLAMCATSLPAAVSADEEEDSAAVPVVDDSNGPIFSDDFESDVISGWSSLGGVAEISLDTSNGHDSNSSLKTSGRQISWHGPSIVLDQYFENLEAYRISGWVYHESSSPETINCTLRFSDSVNVDSYVGVASFEAIPNEWTYFEGVVETPEDLSSTLLYFEAPNAELEFNVDDIQVFGKAPETAPVQNAGNTKKDGVEKYEFDFEAGFDEWVSRGDTRLIRTDEYKCSGNYSMLSTNRTRCWNGPSVSIDGIARGVEYTFEANVLYTDKKADDSHTFLLECQYSYNGTENYSRISDAEVQKGAWTKISGTYTIPEGATNVTLYVQTANLPEDAPANSESLTDLVSFYVDDIKAVRSDIANTPEIVSTIKNMDTSTLLLIIGGVILLIVLIAVIIKVSLSGPKDDDDEESNGETTESNVNNVISALDNKPAAPAVKPAETPEKPKAPEAKKPETKKEESKKAETKKSEEKKEEVKKAEEKKAEPSEEAKKDETAAEENKPANSSNSGSGKKHSKKKKNSNEESREKEVFGIETFSYDDPDSATASDDDPNNDSPFDGF